MMQFWNFLLAFWTWLAITSQNFSQLWVLLSTEACASLYSVHSSQYIAWFAPVRQSRLLITNGQEGFDVQYKRQQFLTFCGWAPKILPMTPGGQIFPIFASICLIWVNRCFFRNHRISMMALIPWIQGLTYLHGFYRHPDYSNNIEVLEKLLEYDREKLWVPEQLIEHGLATLAQPTDYEWVIKQILLFYMGHFDKSPWKKMPIPF
jgi:hypothetical protein